MGTILLDHAHFTTDFFILLIKHIISLLIIIFIISSHDTGGAISRVIRQIPLAETIEEKNAASIRELAHDLDTMGIRVSPSNRLPGGRIIPDYDPDA